MGTFTGERDSRDIITKAKKGEYTKRTKPKPKPKNNNKPRGNGIGATFQRENAQGKYTARNNNKPSVVNKQQEADSKISNLGFNPNIVQRKGNMSFMELGKFRKDKALDRMMDGKIPKLKPYQFSKWSFSDSYAGEGIPIADYLHARKFGMLNAHVAEKIAYYQSRMGEDVKDKEGELLKKWDKIITPEHEQAAQTYQKWANSEYNYGVDSKELKAWYDKWTYKAEVIDENGKRKVVTKYRLGAPAPPVGTKKDGTPVDKEKFERDWTLQMAIANEDDIAQQRLRNEEYNRKQMTADYNDTGKDTINSFADIFVDSIQHSESIPGSWIPKKDEKHDIFVQMGKYHRDYIFKPAIEGEFGVLMNNVLVNLGETADLTAKGFKGFLYGSQGVYGQKEGMSHLDSGDDQWVSSVGKKKQQKLVDMGAIELIKGQSGSRVGGGIGGDKNSVRIQSLKRKLMKAGLWDDFKKFKKEYLKFQKGDTAAGSLKNIPRAYTTKEHYDVDTGNIGTDLLIEMVSDPTLIISGMAGAGRSAVKATTQSTVRKALNDAVQAVGKGIDEANDILIKNNPVIKEYTNQYSKRMADTLLGKSPETIKQEIRGLSDFLERQGAFFDSTEVEVFKNALQKSIQYDSDRLSFKVLSSLNQLDEIVDQVDKSLLKSVFGVPYLAYKGIKLPVKKVRKATREWRSLNRKAVSRLKRQFSNEVTGDLDIFSYKDVQMSKPTEAIMDDVNTSKKIDQEMIKKTEDWLMEIDNISRETYKDHASIYEKVDSKIRELSGGKANTYDEFLEYLDNLNVRNTSLDRLRDIAHNQKVMLDNKYHKGRFEKDVNILNMLRAIDSEGEIFDEFGNVISEHYLDTFLKRLDVDFNGVYDRKVRKELSDLYDEVESLDRTSVNEEYVRTRLKQIEDDYQANNPFFSRKLTGDLKLNVDQKDYVIDREARMPELGNTWSELGRDSTRFFDALLENKDYYINLNKVEGLEDLLDDFSEEERRVIFKEEHKDDAFSAFRKLNDFIDMQDGEVDVSKIRQIEMLEWLKEGINNLNKRILIDLNTEKGVLATDYRLFTRAQILYNSLIDRTNSNLIVDARQSFVELQEDIAHKLFRFIDHNKIHEDLSSMLSSEKLFGRYAASFDEISDYIDSLSFEVKGFNKDLFRVRLINRIMSSSEKYIAFQNFMERLMNNDVALSSNKMLAVVETLLGRHSYKAFGFKNTMSVNQDNLINMINTHLRALSGEDRVSLDSFRNQIQDFDGELYQSLRKRFGDEIDDNEIRGRISAICEGGHLDPTADVKVTLLQSIVRKEDFIDEMNAYSRVQPVWITDIETMGLDPSRYDITAIACKEWKYGKIDNNSSISDILDYIEDETDIRKYHTYMDDDYIDSNISSEALNGMYKNNPRLKSYKDQLDDYKKYYSSNVNDGEVVSEQDILEEFVKDLDNASAAFNDVTPKLVVHNANNFDLNTIFSRLKAEEYQIYPTHIKSLDDLQDQSYNTLNAIVGMQGDIQLTKAQENYVREVVSEYASKFSDGASLDVIDINNVSKDIKSLIKEMESVQSEYGGIKNRGSKSLSELPNDTKSLDDIIKDEDLLNELKDLHLMISDHIDELYKDEDMSYRFIKDLHSENKYNGYEQNSLMKELNEDIDTELLQFGYKNVYNAEQVMKYFRVEYHKLDILTLKQMGELTQNIIKDVNIRMKRNLFVKDTYHDNAVIIKFAKKIASRLDPSDEMYYLRYLEVPENINEQYALAKILYDKFTAFYDERVYKKFEKGYVNYKLLFPKNRQIIYDMKRFGYEFHEMINGTSEDVGMRLIHPEYYSDEKYLYEIYKGVPKPIPSKYSDVLTDDVDAYVRLEKNMAAQNISTKSIIEAGVKNKSITPTHQTKLVAQNQIEAEIADLFSYISYYNRVAVTSDETAKYFKKIIDTVGNTYKYQKERQDLQILSYINQSEDNLLSHLLFHNQVLVIPEKGNEAHVFEYNKLRKLLREYDGDKIVSDVDNGYLIIQIDKRWENKIQIEDDSRTIRSETKMYFGNEDKVYTAPKYKPLGFDSEFDYERLDVDPEERYTGLGSRIYNFLNNYDEHLANLTAGNSIGSVGFLHDMSKQKEIYANIPERIKKKGLSVEYTTNDRFFHNPSMDMSLLGDADNCWYVGNVDVMETDVLFGRYDTLHRLAQRATDELLYIDQYTSAKSNLTIANLFDDALDGGRITEQEVVDALADNDDLVVYAMFDAKTDSGYRIEQINIETIDDLRHARDINAHVIDYASFYDMYEVLNKTTSDNRFFTWWSRFANMHKVMALIKPMTWVRNILDAYQKGIIDTGSPGTYSANIVNAINMLKQYDGLVRIIEKERGINHATLQDLQRNWDSLVGAYSGKESNKMSFETFVMLDGWLNAGRSGGGSKQLLEIEQKVARGHDWKDVTKSDISKRDIIASDKAKFRTFSSDRAGGLYDKLDDAEKSIMDRETFLKIHNEEPSKLTDTNILQYDYLVDSIVRNYKGDKMTPGIYKEGLRRAYDKFSNVALIGMSAPERVLRLAQYLTLADKGFTEGAIHKHIVQSQFDTSVKSTAEKILETIVPFYSFTKSNITYWAKLIGSQPTAFRILEHIYSQLSWNWDHVDLDDYKSMEEYSRGNINPEVFNETIGKLLDVNFEGWFKLNPSFMDAFDLTWAPGEKLGESLYSPLKSGLGYLAYQSGSDLFNILGSDFEEQWAESNDYNRLLNSLPGVSVVKNYMYNLNTVGDDYVNIFLNGLTIKREDLIMDSWERFTEDLEKKGLFWDNNTGRIIALSKANELGLNSNFDDFKDCIKHMLLERGMIWDNNQGQFVNPMYFRPGGLNKDWNFKNKGEWEEFCKLKLRYQHVKWDANQGKFVDPKDFIPGMLNQKGLSFEEVKKYRKQLFNEVWDANQDKFVKEDNFLPGGLNDKNLSWGELAALKYYLHGEEWSREEHAWVKVTKPKFEIENYLYDNKRFEIKNFFDKISQGNHSKEFLDEFITSAYASSEAKGTKSIFGNLIDGLAKQYALTKTYNLEKLTGNPESDKQIFDWIKAQAKNFESNGRYPYRSYGRRWNNYSGRAGWHNFKKRTYMPTRRGISKMYNKISAPKKKYSDPFSFDNDNSGLRMATSKYASYDSYYTYDYNKLYNKKGVGDLLGHYPQTNETMQRYGNRFNNAYKPTTFFQGIYSSSRYDGLDRTMRNGLRKLMYYNH